MKLNERIKALDLLSNNLLAFLNNETNKIEKKLKPNFQQLNNLINKINIQNGWFIPIFVYTQLKSIAQSTKASILEQWTQKYNISDNNTNKTIGVVMAGNIPFVGFHDFLSIIITGHNIQIKLSSKDNILPRAIAEILCTIEPRFTTQIQFVEKQLTNYNAIIATGSNNTARYFEQYFSNVPHIIRKNRNSVAVITGNESQQELSGLADDILLYFGLGCRNVSKVFVPQGYDFNNIFKAIYKYSFFANHNKYCNNYDYNRAVYLINNQKFLENGFFIIIENPQISSPISVLHYEEYDKISNVEKNLKANEHQIQTVVSSQKIFERHSFFGKAQFPELDQYEDGIDTIDFLTKQI